jgi:hypothetical protein
LDILGGPQEKNSKKKLANLLHKFILNWPQKSSVFGPKYYLLENCSLGVALPWMAMENGDSHKLKRLKSAKGPNYRYYKNIVAFFFPLSALSLIHIFLSTKKFSKRKKGDA